MSSTTILPPPRLSQKTVSEKIKNISLFFQNIPYFRRIIFILNKNSVLPTRFHNKHV